MDLSQLDEEDLDVLFEEYGEVVLTDGKPRPVASDVDDDAETLTCKSGYLDIKKPL